jgi:hypothetical protein
MIGAGVAALGTSGAAAGIKVGLSKEDPEKPDPKEEEISDGEIIGVVLGSSAVGVYLLVGIIL